MEVQDVLFEQLVNLTDIVLEGYSCQLESLRHNQQLQFEQVQKKYEQDRHNMISPFCMYFSL